MAGWSMRLDRELIALSKQSLTLEVIAARLNRRPESIVMMAKRLGLSLKADRGLKAKGK
jgi:hypothetical protein